MTMRVLRGNTRFLLPLAALLLLIPCNWPWAAGYTIDWDNLNSGIQPESSDVYIIMASVGQSVTGSMQGGDYILVSGFWGGFFTSGDASGDGTVDIGDVVYLINYLFRGGPPPDPWESGDVNCDGTVDLGDVVYLLNYLYRGGPPPLNCY